MTPLIAEGRPGIFVADRKLLAQRVVYGRWFLPQNYKSGHELQAAIETFLAGRCPGRRRRHSAHGEKRAWRILDWNCVDNSVGLQRDLDTLVSHARACSHFGLSAVRAYRAVFHRWPTVQDMRRTFVVYLPDALPRVYRYLQRRHELGPHRQALNSSAGREWLDLQALRILGRKYVVHMGVAGDAWLFRPVKEIQGRAPRSSK